MEYFKARPSCREKILAWDRKDFSALAASMDQEEIRSMVRQMFDECFYPNYDNASVENILHDYLLLLAYEAEVAAKEDEATLESAAEFAKNEIKDANNGTDEVE